MRYFSTVIIILILTFKAGVCLAGTISAETARVYAERFFHISSTKSAQSGDVLILLEEPRTKSGASAAPVRYIFNKSNGGYVMISAESEWHPILGYSENETFSYEKMPDGMKWVLEIQAEEIRRVRASGEPASPAIQREWSMIDVETKAPSKVKLNTAEFGQNDPYNAKCPTFDGTRCPTGCVATAAAILMHYQVNHRDNAPTSPESVSLPGYSYSSKGYSRSIPGHSLAGRVYRLDEIPWDSFSLQFLEDDVKANLADLMYDLGVSVKMQYSSTGSGTSAEKVINALGTYFKFRKDNRLELRDAYSEEEWFAKIMDSIDNGNPVYYCGTSMFGSHAFLIDGYDRSRNLVRFNFGWNGQDHGSYLRLGADYEKEQQGIFNLVPNTNGEQTDFPAPHLSYFWQEDSSGNIKYYGMDRDGQAIRAGSPFYFNAGYVLNLGTVNISFHTRAVHVSASGTRTSVSGSKYYYGLEPGYMISYSNFGPITLNSSQVNLGDSVELEYSLNEGTEKWLPLDAPSDGSMVISLPVIPMFFMDIPSQCNAGMKYELKLINGDIPWSYYTDWSWRSETEGANAEIVKGGTNNRFYITFSTPGTYSISAKVKFSDRTENVVASVVVK